MPAAPETHAELVRQMAAVLAAHAADAPTAESLAAAAHAWLRAGFDDPEEVADWLAARCFRAEDAQALEQAGFTPAQAARRTRAGRTDVEDTIGHKLAHGDLSLAEARRIITSEFWDS